MKNTLYIILTVLMLSLLVTACGNKEKHNQSEYEQARKKWEKENRKQSKIDLEKEIFILRKLF